VLKRDLWKFRDLSEACENLEKRIKRKERKLSSVKSPRATDIPRHSEGNDFADEIAELEELRVEYQKKCTSRNESYCIINDAISKVKDYQNKEILRLRHIHFMTWNEIADELGFEESTVRKKYAKLFDHVLKTDVG